MRQRRCSRRNRRRPAVRASDDEHDHDCVMIASAGPQTATGNDATKYGPPAAALEGYAIPLSATNANGVRVIVEDPTGVAELCEGRQSIESPTASVSPEATVTSASDDSDEEDVAGIFSTETYLYDSRSEDESCEETKTVSRAQTVSRAEAVSQADRECIPDDCLQSGEKEKQQTPDCASSFLTFRLNYLFVMTAIMLADGLQGA